MRQHNLDMRLTRREVLGCAAGAAGLAALGISRGAGARPQEGSPRMGARPTPQQLAWQEAEFSMFLHFGMNTFTDREWGDGTESPSQFQPARLDADQWAAVARETGFKYVILTAKHHDGFCLWPSRYTEHSVKNSPWRGGKGDVVREMSRACARHGLRFCFYLSPWDRHERTYGDSPAYNNHFKNQLTELLTEYGDVAEVWFDGANGEGPNGKRQEYDWAGFYETIRRHQPKALIAISGPDIRWVGNEDGYARETEWSVQPANPAMHPGVQGEVWWPAECDVSIRPGWFWHAAEDARVKSLEHLSDIYFKSVGRNSVLLLNVPPNRDGLLADPDVQRLREFRAWRDGLFAHDLARGGKASADSAAPGASAGRAVDGRRGTFWAPMSAAGALEVQLGKPAEIGLAVLQEHITDGQHVEEYRIEARAEAGWREVARGTTIGHKKIDRFAPVRVDGLRLVIMRSRATPQIAAFELYRGQTA